MSISKYSIKEKAKRNKKSITLSVEKGVLDELQQEAEQKMEGVNTLVNQIIVLFTMAQACKKSRTRLFI